MSLWQSHNAFLGRFTDFVHTDLTSRKSLTSFLCSFALYAHFCAQKSSPLTDFSYDACPMHCEDPTGMTSETRSSSREHPSWGNKKVKGSGINNGNPTWKSHKFFAAQWNDETRAFLTIMRRKAGLWKIESYFLTLSVSRSWNSDKSGEKQLSMCWSIGIVNLMSTTAAQVTPVAFAASASAENANFLKINAFMSSRTT